MRSPRDVAIAARKQMSPSTLHKREKMIDSPGGSGSDGTITLTPGSSPRSSPGSSPGSSSRLTYTKQRGSKDLLKNQQPPPTLPTDDVAITTATTDASSSPTAASRRLVEYFVMVSCVPITDSESALASSAKSRSRPPDPSDDNMNLHTKARFVTRSAHLQQNQPVEGSVEYSDSFLANSTLLVPRITARYPPTDHADQPLNSNLPRFCLPEEGQDVIHPTTTYKMPRVHHFVLTDGMGGRLYGTALTVYEEFHHNEQDYSEEVEESSDKKKKNKTTATYYAPRVLTLLSTYPYLTAFRTYLTQLYRLATTTNCMTAPIERYVQNITMEVPAPPAGTFEVELCIHPSLGSGSVVKFWAPPADQPIAYVSLPFQVLFECLDIDNILFAWYTLACERKVLLVSSQLSLLTVCSEILCSLLFPMKWSHLYIPVLPLVASGMLDCPMPYLCGISRENFAYAVEDISDETVVVDLDRNVISLGSDTPELPSLPHNRRMKLEETLREHVGHVFWEARNISEDEVVDARTNGNEDELKERTQQLWEEKVQTRDDAFNLAHAPDSASMQVDEDANDSNIAVSKWDAVQEAFLRFYASVLQDYRKFLPKKENMKKRSTWRGEDGMSTLRFQTEEFVAAAPLDFQPFLQELTLSQQFDDFTTRKMHNAEDAPDIKFFDQSVDAKKNRSILRLKKKETPFLHAACAHRELKRIKAVEPNSKDLPYSESSYMYNVWPLSFDEELFGTPRPIPSIISAEFDRRDHTMTRPDAVSHFNTPKRISADKNIVDNIFNLLGDNEKEQTARASSYHYLTASRQTTDERDRYARVQIERYVIVEQKLSTYPDQIQEVAYNKLKKTMRYREDKQVDDLRRCFDKDKLSDSKGLHATQRKRLLDRFATGIASTVRGYTKEGRAVFINHPRADTSWEDKDYYIKGNIYMLERALACTERKTNGELDKVVICYDLNGYELKNSPPPMLFKKVLTDLHEHWPERLEHVFVVDAPFVFRAFWSIIKHFIDPITKDQVQFVNGEKQKKVFRNMISAEQASSFMFSSAMNEDDVDMKSFFYDTTFDQTYETKGDK